MPDTFSDNLGHTYMNPYIPSKIVGFTGIDPDIVSTGSGCDCDNTKLTDEQTAIVNELIDSFFSKIEVQIDSGNVDPDAVEPQVPLTPVEVEGVPHESLDGLLGGNDSGHWHLTKSAYTNLSAYPELEQLKRLIEHNQLIGLQGGQDDEYYHFTKEEWQKLLQLIPLLFPNGSPTPVIPPSPTPPSTPDDGEGEGGNSSSDDEIPDYSALFENKEPVWQTIGLLANYKTVKQEGRMYYGTTVKGDKVTSAALVVPAIYKNDKNDAIHLLSSSSSDLTSFTKLESIAKARGITLGDMAYGHIGIAPTLKSKYDNRRHFCVYLTYLNSTSKFIYYYGSSSSVHNKGTKVSGFLAGAYKNDAGNAGDQKFVCANGDGMVCIIAYKKDSTTSITTELTEKGTNGIGMPVNPGCLRYGNGVFCAAGKNGTANSVDGSSWNVNRNAPKNLTGLHFRADFAYKDKTGKDCVGAFIACSRDTRIFYYSADGYDWTQCSTKKVPLDSLIAIAYNPAKKQYCAVGKPGNVACLTTDFTNWTPTYVSRVNIDALDVTYAFDKFVLMPKDSATLFYYKP